MKYYRSSAISFVRPRLIRAPFSHRIQHFFMFLCIVWFHPTLIVSSVPQTSDPLFASSRTVASLTILQINQTEPIQSLLYNDRNSSLYVGTVNAIHLLKDDTWIRPNDRFVKQVSFPKSDSFNLSTWVEPVRYVSTFSTNLIDDDDRCAPWPVSCRYNRSRPINHNRLLLHVPHSKYTLLIACGTAYQGMCYILSESNGQLSGDLLGDPTLVSNYVASSRSSLAVQVFVNRIPTYFIAHAPDGRPADYRPPTFSARRMNNTKTAVNLVYRYDKQSLRTTLRFRSDLAAEQKFPVEYVYGFSHGKYVYIVKNQPLVEGDPKSQMWETRLGRVCVEDDRFFSYSEIPMSCNVSSASVSASASSASGPMELVYERSMAADLAEADPALIQRLSLHTDNRALFIAFGSLQSVSHSRTGLASGSVVCAFGMESIVERFEKAINACLDGDHVVTGLMSQYESVGAKRCQRSSSSDSDYQCHGSNLNHYIESHLSLHGVPLVSLPQHVVSSLKVTLQGKDSAFQAFMIGSDDGVVIKASRQVGGQIRLASQLKVSNRPIVANSPWDRSRQFLFVAAGSDVFKYPLTSCSLYADSCSSCVTASEPLGCGWLSAGPLGSIGTCVSRADYEQIKTKITEPHLLSHEHCSPRLLAIYPTSGPTAGGTQLRLTGHHLAAANAVRENPNYLVNVTVGGRSCTVQPTEGSNLTCQVPPADPNTWSAQVRVCVQDFTRLQHKLFDVDGCSELGTFSYVSATVEKVSPNFGPVSGGTIVHLTGKHLDSGSSRSVHINEIVCEILSYNQTMLACRTGRLKPRNKSSKNTTTDETNLPEFASSEDKLKQFNQNSSILLTIDGFTTKFDSASLRFEYRPDPNVRDFRPRAAIPGIGMYFTFTGRHLDSVLHPQLSLRVLGQQRRELQLNTPCLVLASSERPSTAINVLLNRTNSMNVTNTWNNGRWMADQDNTNEVISDDSLKSTAALKSGKDQRLVCLVPALPADWAISSAHAPLIAYLNLTLDGSQALSRHLTNAHILLYPLPDLRPPVLPVVARSATATGGRRTNRLIRIEGNNLSTEYPIRIQLTSGDQRVFCNRWQSTSSRLIECEMSPASIGLADEWKVDMLIGRLALPYGSVRFGESNIAHRGWLFWIGWLFIVLIIAGSAVFCLLVRPQILLPKFSWIGKAAQSKKEAAVSYNPVGNPNHSLNPHDSWFGPSSGIKLFFSFFLILFEILINDNCFLSEWRFDDHKYYSGFDH